MKVAENLSFGRVSVFNERNKIVYVEDLYEQDAKNNLVMQENTIANIYLYCYEPNLDYHVFNVQFFWGAKGYNTHRKHQVFRIHCIVSTYSTANVGRLINYSNISNKKIYWEDNVLPNISVGLASLYTSHKCKVKFLKRKHL